MPDTRAILYGFWLSSCTWRVRTALRLKNVDFEERAVDIVKANDQRTASFRAINPAQKVPALVIGPKNEPASVGKVKVNSGRDR